MVTKCFHQILSTLLPTPPLVELVKVFGIMHACRKFLKFHVTPPFLSLTKMSNAVSLVVLSCLLTGVQCRSTGASSASCTNISPDHSVSEHNATAQTSTVPYVLTGLPPNGNYTPGMSYNRECPNPRTSAY